MDIYQKRIIKSLKKIGISGANLEVPPDPKLGDYALPCFTFARELKKEGVEISLAIYIDAFSWRNPRVPDNVRYAVNFYQRSGILKGFPMRGKSKLIPEDAQATLVLGSYQIKPQTEFWGWSWNLVQPLLYRHHHRIAHDLRLREYLLEIVNLNLSFFNDTVVISELAE